MKLRSTFLALVCGLSCAWALALAGCGYGFQGTRNVLFEKEGVRRVFVAPLENNTFKPGVENLLYNEMLKNLAASRKVEIVQEESLADVVLNGVVSGAAFSPSAATTANLLFPSDRIPRLKGSPNITVASEYSASLTGSFQLMRRVAVPGKNSIVWSSGFARSRSFPATNQLGAFGTTSALINESEFDRALRDLADSVSRDMIESMFVAF